ncbi:MAG: FAD-dependent monooxygenase [Pseudomonadota bacterium]|nr:FAD-dependent monooxygenase [Pseudomonadota bacterium]
MSEPAPAQPALPRQVDVAIVGGGMVGATLALLLVNEARVRAAQIVLVEPRPVSPPAPGSAPGLRVSAIAPANRARLADLGVWDRMDATRIARVERMAVWHEAVPPDSPDVLRFDAAEGGAPELGCIVENDALQAALMQACRERGIVILNDSLQALAIHPGEARLQLGLARVDAQLVVGADGAASTVRELMQMPATTREYGQRGIVATITTGRSHRGTAFQRFLGTGPLALLPLPGNTCSIVWSATEARAAELLAMPAEQFNNELTAASAGVLGALELASERASFPLRRLTAGSYVAPRVALVGDAAHVIHPLAGQGVNQGLEDAVVLAAQLAARPPRESVGALRALRRYERERRAGNALVGEVVDGLDRLFTGSGPLTAWAAREAMALVGRLPFARRFLAGQAAGQARPRA